MVNPNFEELRTQIKDLHQQFIEAHLNKDVEFIVNSLSDNYISVSNGDIDYPTMKDMRVTFNDYLNNSTFTEYRDVTEPIINFSDDGSLAWVIVQVQIAGNRKKADGSEGRFDSTWAWISLYKRENDKWITLTDVSTVRPSS
ncbi:MAG: nuclear transport factor 2 family protein [Candidatus Kariarchaeaceae archaeon]